VVRLSALRASCLLLPGRFLVLIFGRGWVKPRAIVQLEGLDQLKKSNDLIGKQTHNLLACTIVPQPTTLPLAHNVYNKKYIYKSHCSIVGWGIVLQAGRSPVRVLCEVDFFNLPNPSCTIALGSTHPLTEMSTRNHPGGKTRLACRVDYLAAICEPNVWKCGSLNLSQP
jgi:hypothetical protein